MKPSSIISLVGGRGILAGLVIVTAPSASHAAEKEVTPLNQLLQEKSGDFKAWDIGAEVRVREEIKENAGAAPSTDFISGIAGSRAALCLRERTHAGYQATPWISAFVEGQDASAHEDAKADNAFDLYQACLTLGNAKEFPLTAKIGRQELAYGDERFIGKGNWNIGRSFDAVKLRMENEFGWVDAIFGRVVVPNDNNFDVSNDYDNLSGMYAGSRALMPWQETEVYFLARNYGDKGPNAISPGVPGSPSTQRDIYTLGSLWKSDPEAFEGWDYSVEGAMQFGSVYNATQKKRLNQQSYGVFASGGYTWKNAWGKPRLGMGFEYGSGDDNPNDGKVQTFENLFGTSHKPYGLMDLAGARNMQIPKLSFSIKPVKGLTVSADCLAFLLASTDDYFYPDSGSGRKGNGYGIHSGYGSYVGTELDLYASCKINSWSGFEIGCGHFFTGDYIKDTASAAGLSAVDADWFYSQLTFNF